jgi:hypothetical protein
MTNRLEDARRRSAVIAERVRQRTDLQLRGIIEGFDAELTFAPLERLAISEQAWEHVVESGFDPKLVFAHPMLLCQHPRASEYYRGIALLSRKRVSEIAVSVDSWESGARATVSDAQSVRVASLYNAVISSIIEGATEWTLENGYRNIIANMGIGLDGTVRNRIGRDAEQLVKGRITEWLDRRQLIVHQNADGTQFGLPVGYTMRYGSEPDIQFQLTANNETSLVATIEIKGGKDAAGALERLGAVQKSFEETPPNCANFLIAGVITPEMAQRLDAMGVAKRYLLDDLIRDGEPWVGFLNEVFHHTVRITPSVIESA